MNTEDNNNNKNHFSSENKYSSDYIFAKGTSFGLNIRIDVRVPAIKLLSELDNFIFSRLSFLQGSSVSLEFIGQKQIKDEEFERLKLRIYEKFEIDNSIKVTKGQIPSPSYDLNKSKDVMSNDSSNKSLFGGVSGLSDVVSEPVKTVMGNLYDVKSVQESNWDAADTKTVYQTLRSGQRIETEHNLVIIGDVNSGAELIAGGNIIVLGNLRGIAHAGAYDETGGGRTIFSLDLNPTQLRIGSIISRGTQSSTKESEIAWLDNNRIVVEAFSVKSVLNRYLR